MRGLLHILALRKQWHARLYVQVHDLCFDVEVGGLDVEGGTVKRT